MEEPLISIIVPVYRTEKYLNRCVTSIVNQTYANLEIILVDDDSPDNCPEICDQWKEKDCRIRVVHKENGGAGSARNAGIDIATGEYIEFVDSDDWIENMMCECLRELIEEYRADMVLCEMRRISRKFTLRQNKPNNISVWDRKECLNHFFRTNGERDTHSVCGRLIRRELLRDFSFIEGKMNEDVHACYYLATMCRKAVYTNAVLYNYYCNMESITRCRFTAKKLDLLEIWKIVKEMVSDMSPEYERECDLNYKRACFTLLSRMYIDGYDRTDPHLEETRKELRQILREAYMDLMKWKMPLSRKILLSLLVI